MDTLRVILLIVNIWGIITDNNLVTKVGLIMIVLYLIILFIIAFIG